MATQYLIASPLKTVFTDPLRFKSVFYGKIYIGEVDTDPLNPSNQQQIYVVDESNNRTPVTQPVDINSGGFAVYNGDPAKFVCDRPYSIVVLDKVGAESWRIPDIRSIDLFNVMHNDLPGRNYGNGQSHDSMSISGCTTTFATVSSMKNASPINGGTHTFEDGQAVEWLGYNEIGDGGGNVGIVKSGSPTENLGSVFTLTPGFYVETESRPMIAEQWGIFPSSESSKIDMTSRFQVAHDNLIDSDTLEFIGSGQDGYYFMNAVNEKLQLSRRGQTRIRAFDDRNEGFSMRFGYHSYMTTWNFYTVRGIDFICNSGESGVDIVDSQNPELAGRWVFKNCVTGGWESKGEYGFRKTNGNIGNKLEDHTFVNSDFGYYAKGAGPSTMHVGADIIQGQCHFESIDKAAIYIDGESVDGVYLPEIEAIIEGCSGFGLFIKDISSNVAFATKALKVDIENSATADEVTINGTKYTPKDIRIENCQGIPFEGSFIKSIALVNSTITCNLCRFDAATGKQDFDVDGNSSIYASNAIMNGSANNSVLIESLSGVTGPQSAFRTSPRSVKNFTSAAIVNTFETIQTLSGTSSIAGTLQDTGIIEKPSNNFVVPSSSYTLFAPQDYQLITGRWYVWTVSVRMNDGEMFISMEKDVFAGGVQSKGFQWETYGGVFNAQNPGSVNLKLSGFSKDGTNFNLQALQLKEFSSKREAIEYFNSRQVAWL